MKYENVELEGGEGKKLKRHQKIVEEAGAIYEKTHTDMGVTFVYFTCPISKSTFVLRPEKLNCKNISDKRISFFVTKIEHLKKYIERQLKKKDFDS